MKKTDTIPEEKYVFTDSYESLKFIGTRKTNSTSIKLISYSNNFIEIKEINEISEMKISKNHFHFIIYSGLHNVKSLYELGQKFNIHPIVLEDIANTEHKPKIEIFDDYIFTELRLINYHPVNALMDIDQISMILGKNYMILFLEQPENFYFPLFERLKISIKNNNPFTPDYLFYSIFDVITNSYYSIMEQLGDKIEELEDRIYVTYKNTNLNSIFSTKRLLMTMRKSIWPLREAVKKVINFDSDLIKKDNYIYFKDLYDHCVQIMDTIETQRELISEVYDIHLSSNSNRMNGIMKVLTIISTIFIPLTFISSIYGMNFKYMPELEMRMAYPFVMTTMALIGIVMLIIFKIKKWF